MWRRFQIAYLSHSFRSDWNNGNAHFLRGLLAELGGLGHQVTIFEPEYEWSIDNLRAEADGEASLRQFAAVYPRILVRLYPADQAGSQTYWREALRGFEVVVLHEWNRPVLAQVLLALRSELRFKLVFHDTHHRASSTPEAIAQFGTDRFDGVMVFGEALRTIYRERFGIERVWTVHEAADTRVFRPVCAGESVGAAGEQQIPLLGNGKEQQTQISFGNDNKKGKSEQQIPRTGNDKEQRITHAGSVKKESDVVWIGNWGDDERSEEIREYLLRPAAELPWYRFTIYGVRYPEDGLLWLARAGVRYGGYLPNLCAPGVYAASALTVHIPRQQYNGAVAGIPTIRVFEALACGVPLLSAPWQDTEQLFREGDFRFVHSGAEMRAAMEELLTHPELAAEQAARGLETVLAHHTCLHRAEQVSSIFEELFR